MGIVGSSYSSMSFPIFSANCAYVYNSGLTTGTGAAGETSELLIGTGTLNSDLVLFTGGVDTANEAVRISGADQTIEVQKGVTLNETLDVTGAASFGSTVLLDANPTTALQAATKQYVDNAVTAGVHIHEPVRVVAASNLTATYAQGGTTFNITDITLTTTVTTSVNHGLSVNDQIWLTSTAGNGLSTNTAYFVFSTPALNTLTLSLTFGGAQITGLTNAAGLTYATRANSGVGATLTNSGTQVALSIDSVSLSSTNRVLVRGQTNAEENGAYTVTTVGSGSTNWVLTRATDSNMVNPSDPNGLGTGDYFFVQEGLTGTGDSFVLTTEPNTMIIGYTALTYTQFSGAITYVGGTNIDVTGQTISLTGTVAPTNGGTGTSTVTTGDLLYGSGTNAWSKLGLGSAYQSLAVNGSGTQVEWNAVNLSSAVAVTGTLGATYGGTGQTTYATGDILYSSATNTLAKLAGSTSTSKHFLSQTGTGSASAAPAWVQLSATDITSGTLPATRGGTDNSSYAVGDLLYADTTTSLAKLADVATGNALISGGVSAAPAWGKVALASAVSGTLPIANGGTNSTATPTAGGVNYGTGTAHAFTSAGTSGQILTSAGASAPVWANNPPAFPSGTVMLFVQTAAPTGWTKSTTHDNKALRIVSGTASSGGSVAFTTAFASQSVTGSVAATAAATATNQATTAGGSVGATSAATATNQATTAGGSVGATSAATATNQATTAGGTVGVSVSAGTLAVGAGTFAVGATTLATTQIPSHTHTAAVVTSDRANAQFNPGTAGAGNTGATGGGGSHTHGLTGAPSISGSPSVTGTSFTGTSHNHTQDAHSHTSGGTFTGTSHNHTQDAHSHTSGGTFTGTSHNHTQDAHSHTSGAFTGNAINLAVSYVDAIIATKD
jgi:hypothetical protein